MCFIHLSSCNPTSQQHKQSIQSSMQLCRAALYNQTLMCWNGSFHINTMMPMTLQCIYKFTQQWFETLVGSVCLHLVQNCHILLSLCVVCCMYGHLQQHTQLSANESYCCKKMIINSLYLKQQLFFTASIPLFLFIQYQNDLIF